MIRLSLTAVLATILLVCATRSQPLQEAKEKTDEEILKEARISSDAVELAKYLRGQIPGNDERKQGITLVEQLGDPSFARRDEAESKLAKLLPGAIVALRPATRSADFEVAERAAFLLTKLETDGLATKWRAAVRVLARHAPANGIDTLLAVLPLSFDDATEEETLTALMRLASKGEKLPEIVFTGLDDADASRRAASALLVGRYGSPEQRKKVLLLLTDPVLEVRFRAAQGLLGARDRAGLAALVQTVREGTPGVARQASDQLTALAGSGGVGSIDVGTPSQRANLAKAWEAWLQTTGRQIDLTRADVEFGQLNRSIVALHVARKFLAGAEIGNVAGIKSLIALPYTQMETNVAATAQELENLFNNQGLPGPPRGEILPTTRIQTLDTISRGPFAQTARNVTTRHPRDELIAIESMHRFPGNPGGQRVVVFVRVSRAGGPGKVVGYTMRNFDRVVAF